MTYCQVSDIRRICGLSTNDIDDSTLSNIRDNTAIPELNQDINYEIENEKVKSISQEKSNYIDGANSIFYVRELHQTFKKIGDYDDNGEVTASDIKAYTIDSAGNRNSNLDVTLLDANIGKLEIKKSDGTAIPSNEQLYLSYAVAPLDEKTPHNLIKTACAQLTAAYGFTNIDASKLNSYKIGKVSIRKQSQGFQILYDQYQRTINKINQRSMMGFGENKNEITGGVNV